jgi:transposase
MVVADGQGIPLSCTIHSASPSEVKLVQQTLSKVKRKPKRLIPLIADKAYDSDPLRKELAEQSWELISPHRKNRVKGLKQDGRKLRRYRKRWKIERTISWIASFRRLVVRYERFSCLYQAFIHLACAIICLRRF